MDHVRAECKGNCDPYGCNLCNLFICVICNGAEGSLPTDCPGVKMMEEQEQQIYAGKLDYRVDKGWIKPDGTGQSMGDMDIKYPHNRERN